MTDIDFSAQVSGLLDQGRQADALALARRFAAQRHPDAIHLLATWHIIGTIVTRDLTLARSLLNAAAAQGHEEATRTLVAMLANASGGPADWPSALRLLRDMPSAHPRTSVELRLLDAMDILPDGLPKTQIHAEPLDAGGIVRRLPSLLTAEECAHVIAATGEYLAPAMVFDPATGRQIRNPVRTADAMVVSPTREDLVLRAIALRLASASGTLVDQAEATSVMRYSAGQEFKLHHDSLDGTSNQRVMTILVYLNDGFAGGETLFPHLGLTVAPRRGDAIIFDNVRDGRRLPEAQHAGLPILRGEKWLLSRWIRERPFSLWSGPERTSDSRSPAGT